MAKPRSNVFTFRSVRLFFRHHLVHAKWVEFAMQLNEGMVTARQSGDGTIHATVEEVADWSGVSHRTAWRVWKRLVTLGWVSSPKRGVIVFDYSRKSDGSSVSEASESATVAETLNGVVEPSRMDIPIPTALVTPELPELPPSGADGCVSEPLPSVAGAVIAALVEAGADRAGAVKAVKTARKAGALDLARVREIAAAVAALPVKPYRPGGLLCAGVARPELGAKLVRDHAQAMQRKSDGKPVGTFREPGSGPRVAPVFQSDVNPWEAMRLLVRDWLALADLADPSDLAWFRARVEAHGWSLAQLRSIPDLRGAQLW